MQEVEALQQKVQKENRERLAREILNLSRDTLLIHLRFLDTALHQLTLESYTGTLSTDGNVLFYNPEHVIHCYKEEKNRMIRDYLHELLHGIFRHMYLHKQVNPRYWNLACDIAVEAVIGELQLSIVSTAREQKQQAILLDLKEKVGKLTAEKLYYYFRKQSFSADAVEAMQRLFLADEHSCWYWLESGEAENGVRGGQGDPGEESDGNSDSELDGNGKGSSGENADTKSDAGGQSQSESTVESEEQSEVRTAGDKQDWELEKQWKQISEVIQMELEAFSQQQGLQVDALLQNVEEKNRKKYDYTKFLKKFTVHGEVLHVNEDEFDYIFYTYGLQLYKKMPLIEPLEYKEVKKIRDFVIAIDTSGSVNLQMVQQFIQKTYDILQSTESFFQKINLYIIQCDAQIQHYVRITSKRELRTYLKTLQIHGRGGTDFRPVFTFVEELIQKKAFQDLRGLLYFTDGYGIFPVKKPSYDAAFVFVGAFHEKNKIPAWAIRLILEEDELNESDSLFCD